MYRVYFTQERTIDPHMDLSSELVNKLTSLISPVGRGIVHGFKPESSTDINNNPTKLIISPGVALKDFTVINNLRPIEIDMLQLNANDTYYVVLDYTFYVSENEQNIPYASILLLNNTEYLSVRNYPVIICQVTIDNNKHITNIDISKRELTPIHGDA